jgi:hypothetical protein
MGKDASRLAHFDSELSTLENRKRVKVGRKRFLALGVILAIAGAALAYSYFSNPLSSTTVVSDFAITLSGSVPTSGFLNVDQEVAFTAKSNTGGDLTGAALEVSVTRAGAAGDLGLKISGNPITPSCSGNTCVYTGAIGTINPTPGNIGTTWTWHVSGSYSIVVRAEA